MAFMVINLVCFLEMVPADSAGRTDIRVAGICIYSNIGHMKKAQPDDI